MRNVDLRPYGTFAKAYMHNGYFKTLSGMVHFYDTRGVKPVCSGSLTEHEALARDCWPAPEVMANVNHGRTRESRPQPGGGARHRRLHGNAVGRVRADRQDGL